MYSLSSYGRMIADEIRTDAYAKALQAAVHADSVVLDIGAGTGIFSLLACQFGARKVYAIEPSDAIGIVEEMASMNGFADRIQCIQGISTETSLPEKADVIVSDLRGVSPLFQQHLPSIIDARHRLLSPGGHLIPKHDVLWGALVEAPRLYDGVVKPWARERFDLNMDPVLQIVTNQWKKATVMTDQLITEPCCWTTIDYHTVESLDVSAEMKFRPIREGIAHGLVLWFDSVLWDGIEFSNRPGRPELIYGSSFFPWPSSVALSPEDTVTFLLRADLIDSDYVWTWETFVYAKDARRLKAHFRQSTFFGEPLSPVQLRKRAGSYQPALNEDGVIDVFILRLMDRTRSNEEIAGLLVGRFPSHFSSYRDALTRITGLSAIYSH